MLEPVLKFDLFVLFRMVLILNQSGASHAHEFPTHHSHGHINASVKAALVHVVADLLHSVGVLLAATIIHFWVSRAKNTKGAFNI